IGCIVLYTGQGKFNGSTEDTLEYVVKQANLTADNLRNVSGYLAAAKGIKVATVLLGPDVQTSIDEIDSKINSSATTVADKTEKNSNTIEKVLHDVRLSLIILAAVMLLLTFLGFLFSILGMQSLVSILVVIGWILVTGTFILCGVFLLLHNVVADTCVAMDQWVQNPTAHTALDDILPCVDNATANETFIRSKQVSFQLVNVVNQVLNSMSNANIPSFLGPPLYVNQSGPLVPVLCNPFNADLTDRECRTGEVGFNNATQVWKNYVCQVSSSGVCTTMGRLTPDYYDQMAAAVNVSFGLYHYGPFLVQLIDCTFVRDTFTDISRNHCPGLKKYVKWIYIGLVMVSVAVMLSLVFWMNSSAAARGHGKHFESNNSSKGKTEEEYWPLSEGKPYMLFIMAEYHVRSPYQLVLPIKIHSLLPDARVPVVLKCRKKKWMTSFHGDGNKRFDVSGWRVFATENNLKEGDGCVFELTKWSSKIIVFEVQILNGDMPPELLERCQEGSSEAPIIIN
ncbi:B3 domain-containing protein, partial [Thalictrum thalictroides]